MPTKRSRKASRTAPAPRAAKRAAKPGAGKPPRRLDEAGLARLLNVADAEAAAARIMARPFFDYYAGGAEDERTLARNREGMGRWVLLHRVLSDVSAVDPATTMLGTAVSMPVALAPAAFHRLAHPDGEIATARGAGAAGALLVASTISSASLEDVADAATGPLWFQLYVYRDRGISRDLIDRAERAGYKALMLTVDTPILGRRERDFRNGFMLPADVRMANFEGFGDAYARWTAPGGMFAHVHQMMDPSLSWETVAWLRERTRLPIVLKGIVRADDARRAVDAGASAIVVSNHGGRQLDGSEATILALPDVVDAVGASAEVYVDGGFRRGTDVVKALALGARAVLIGRPYLWGLAAGGEAGVRRVLEILKSELELALALAGCRRPSDLDRSFVRPA